MQYLEILEIELMRKLFFIEINTWGHGGTIKIGALFWNIRCTYKGKHQNESLPYLDIDRRTRSACNTHINEKKRENNVLNKEEDRGKGKRERERKKEKRKNMKLNFTLRPTDYISD